jgi:hypothetical protein
MTLAMIGSEESLVATSSESPLIIFDQASLAIFPESWRTAKVNAKAELLDTTERERCREIVSRALGKYPADMLKTTLKKIYCLGRLEYSGAVTGGTRSRNSVYVVCKPTYASSGVERIIHAEYSSVLFQKFPQHFDAEAWKQINPPNFNYLGSGVEAVKRGKASRRADPAIWGQGFIQEYAKASVEEDFNSHAAALFMGDEQYWTAVDQHPKLKAKSDFVVAFYTKVHASLDVVYFQKLRADWLCQRSRVKAAS